MQSCFPGLSEEDVSNTFPPKCQIDILKLSNKAVAYFLDDHAVFFDANGKGDLLVPALHTLWQHPKLVSSFQTWSEVSTKV